MYVKISAANLWRLGQTGILPSSPAPGKSIDEAVSKMYRNVEGFAFIGVYYRSKDDFLSLDTLPLSSIAWIMDWNTVFIVYHLMSKWDKSRPNNDIAWLFTR